MRFKENGGKERHLKKGEGLAQVHRGTKTLSTFLLVIPSLCRMNLVKQEYITLPTTHLRFQVNIPLVTLDIITARHWKHFFTLLEQSSQVTQCPQGSNTTSALHSRHMEQSPQLSSACRKYYSRATHYVFDNWFNTMSRFQTTNKKMKESQIPFQHYNHSWVAEEWVKLYLALLLSLLD